MSERRQDGDPARRPRLVLVTHPPSWAAAGEIATSAVRTLERDADIVARLETGGGERKVVELPHCDGPHGAVAAGGDGAHVAELLRRHGPDVVVAAGGDGTVNEVLNGIRAAGLAPAPALGILPLGTGNNAARSLGLVSLRRGRTAIELAVGAIVEGEWRATAAGEANGRLFLGSFAVGMDADILVLRNRLRRRLPLPGQWGGYALYLAACAASLGRAHGGVAHLLLDGAEERRRLFGLVALSQPIYAGEFRFAGEPPGDRLGVHVVAGALEYLREYPTAWRRHVGHQRGEAVQPSPCLRHARALEIEMERPVAAQIDGEELTPAAHFAVRLIPDAVRVCMP